MFKRQEVCQRLAAVEDIGPLTATAVFSTFGGGRQFHNGRQFAVALGLVPRQQGISGKVCLLGISKHVIGICRTLLVHGACSVVWRFERKQAGRAQLLGAAGCPGVRLRPGGVAVANKNAHAHHLGLADTAVGLPVRYLNLITQLGGGFPPVAYRVGQLEVGAPAIKTCGKLAWTPPRQPYNGVRRTTTECISSAHKMARQVRPAPF